MLNEFKEENNVNEVKTEDITSIVDALVKEEDGNRLQEVATGPERYGTLE